MDENREGENDEQQLNGRRRPHRNSTDNSSNERSAPTGPNSQVATEPPAPTGNRPTVSSDQPDELNQEAANEEYENEENLHEQRHKQRHANHHHNSHHNHHHNHHHHHHHNKNHNQLHHPNNPKGHVKELIKPDRTVRVARLPAATAHQQQAPQPAPSPRVATVVDEEQLHRRFIESISGKRNLAAAARGATTAANQVGVSSSSSSGQTKSHALRRHIPVSHPTLSNSFSSSSHSTSSSSSGRSGSDSRDLDAEGGVRSPPPAAIIIPPNVAKSLSYRARSPHPQANHSTVSGASSGNQQTSSSNTTSGSHNQNNPLPASQSSPSQSSSISREQLEYGPLLRQGEVQVLYRSPDADSIGLLDRSLKDEQAKLVAPSSKQSPIAIMTLNPTYELQNKPLIIEYPATIENLRLNNTGFSWEVKIPYQISMTTALYGAHLNTAHRYRLDQFHCHWGANDNQGSEHTVDNRCYSAELHFVHYNMEKYHTMSKAARHPDGLVVLSVFLEAEQDHHNHAELEKIVAQLKAVGSKGEHAIIRQAVRIENLLPTNRSYWSYQGSLTTPPYFESVTWFVLKHPIKCSVNQIQKFRNLRSSLRHRSDDNNNNNNYNEASHIQSNHRKTQPLNGRTIVTYDESLRSTH